MRKINLILLGGVALIYSAEGTDITNRAIVSDRSWGRLNYTAFSHLDVTFDQADLRRVKNSNEEGGLRIPKGVTHVYLRLSGSFEFVEFPETVRFINKDIFKECDTKAVLLSDNTAKNLLWRSPNENDVEGSIRKYFSLNDNIEIIVNRVNGFQNKNQNVDTLKAPSSVEAKGPKNDLLDEIHTFNKNNLKHVEEQKKDVERNDVGNNNFIDELNKFDRSKLKPVEKIEKVNKELENPFLEEIHNFDRSKLKPVEGTTKANESFEEPFGEQNKVLEPAIENEKVISNPQGHASDDPQINSSEAKPSRNSFLDEIHNFDTKKLRHHEQTEKTKVLDPLAKELLEKIEYNGNDNEDSSNATDWED